LALVSHPAIAAVVAFPGAEGEGRYVTGGRGGDVYHVTTLSDSGPGSLRHGLDTAFNGPRTIVFDIGGTIALESGLGVRNGNITIAGETAPGMGIAITQHGLGIGGGNVILRHIRVRPGDARKGSASENGFNGDAISINASRVIVDHCSASWGIDENLSAAGRGFKEVTVQYCTISEALDQTGLYHGEWDANYNPGGSERHSMGSLIKPQSGNAVATFHHNLWSGNGNRNPAVGTYDSDQTLKIDLVNNVIYNNRSNGYSSGASRRVEMNYVGNYIIAGPATRSSSMLRAFDANANNNVQIYQLWNKVDADRDGVLDGVDYGWQVITGEYTQKNTPFNLAPVTTQFADEAYRRVVEQAGAFPWKRDSVDERLFDELNRQTGMIIDSQDEVGGYPVLPVIRRPADWDTDQDGMPDYWEKRSPGMDWRLADHNGDLDQDGYTNLEEYLHFAATGVVVPEPATGLLLLLGFPLVWRLRCSSSVPGPV
jgi:hypothetical protein